MNAILISKKGEEKSIRKQILDQVFSGAEVVVLHTTLGCLDTANAGLAMARSELIAHNMRLEYPMPKVGKTVDGTECTVMVLHPVKKTIRSQK